MGEEEVKWRKREEVKDRKKEVEMRGEDIVKQLQLLLLLINGDLNLQIPQFFLQTKQSILLLTHYSLLKTGY